jgi:glycosyltransferase involved in cell wall biosynthesis
LNLLIYYPFSTSSSAIQSQGEVLSNLAGKVIFLTSCPRGAIHQLFEQIGVMAYSAWSDKHSNGPAFFYHHIKFLRKFCKKHQIDKVIVHTESLGVVAGIALWKSGIPFYYFRHNLDYIQLTRSRKNAWLSKWAQRFATRIAAISEGVRYRLIEEGVKPEKIERVNLSYDFSMFSQANESRVAEIREKYKAELIIVVAARLDSLKRHDQAMEVIKAVMENGADIKMICIGEGPHRPVLEEKCRQLGLQNNVFLPGFVTDVSNYYHAADLIMHLSVSEASCNVAKEAGIASKTIIVCENTGDFSDYLVHGQNAFLVDKKNPVPATVALLKKIYSDKNCLPGMGQLLQQTIQALFSADAVKESYRKLLSI